MNPGPTYGDSNWDSLQKILQALVGPNGDGSGGILGAIGGGVGGGPVLTLPNAVISVTGTAVLAIPANARGMIVAAQGNAGSLFVGGSGVTNGGAARGIELSPLGFSPILRGPVYVNGTAGDIGGVTVL